MMPSQTQQSRTSLSEYPDLALTVVYNFTSVFTAPIEMVLRLQYGTRYFSPVTQFLTWILMTLLPVFSSMADSFSHMLPFHGFHGLSGMFGIGTLSQLYFAGSFIHGIRLWRRMIRMSREEHSYWEGLALPIFKLVPGSFWIVRIVYEPLFVIILTLVLSNFFILQDSAVHYLIFAAIMLTMKQYVAWYMAWQFLRGMMDARNVGPILAKVVDNTATEDELSTLHIASIPRDIPDDMRKDAVAHIARAFSAWKERP
jgi:hypothetical protein